jgi:hypothetical protein
MNATETSKFQEEMYKLFEAIKPKNIIETGTHLGLGTTTMVWRALQKYNITDYKFVTIEVNPHYYNSALAYFQREKMNVDARLGLSLPKNHLPDELEIKREFVDEKEFNEASIYYDFNPGSRPQEYFAETNFNVEDDLLAKVMKEMDYKLDFALLDSSGHLGWREFCYLMPMITGNMWFMLDDVFHCKHQKTLQYMKSNPEKFEITVTNPERYGFAVVKYTH